MGVYTSSIKFFRHRDPFPKPHTTENQRELMGIPGIEQSSKIMFSPSRLALKKEFSITPLPPYRNQVRSNLPEKRTPTMKHGYRACPLP
ncbi:hypothetical protein J6590_008281 [Homalodisca vitripennis]|nr:hypothetical protein J6590_008281 [Homalodisca vitripennis]